MKDADLPLERSLHVLLVAIILAQVAASAAGHWQPYWNGAPFTVLVAVSAWIARYRPLIAACLVIGVGTPVLGLITLSAGGTTSPQAIFFSVPGLVAWAWLGRGWGLGVTALLLMFLVAGLRVPLARPAPEELQISYVASTFIGGVFVAAVMRALRASAEEASVRADEAAAADRQARQADAARDRLLAAVSHELRTPLDAILGYAELLSEEAAGDRKADLDRISAAGRHLLGLIDDILVAGREDLTISLAPLEVDRLVQDVVATTAPLATASGNRVTVNVAPGPPVTTDARRARQILLNLLTNAHKYTRHGLVEVEVTHVADGVQCVVRDTGAGIPSDRLHLLFQPFVQLHDGDQRQPGVGLGLALSQRLANRLGGWIEATSTFGSGSTFTLFLPSSLRAGAT